MLELVDAKQLVLMKISPEKYLGRLDDLSRKYSNDSSALRQINSCRELIYSCEEMSAYANWDKMTEALLEYKKCEMVLEALLEYGEWDRKLEGIKGLDSI